HQTVLFGGGEHSCIITDDSGVSTTASQLLHHVPDWGNSSIRIEAVDYSVGIGRKSGVSRKEQAINPRWARTAPVPLIVERSEKALPERHSPITPECVNRNDSAHRHRVHRCMLSRNKTP